ncbi:patatin-like phospholipase family protein [Reinekea marina]|uniref:Patatin-like phospholipase family protein n=1 Tax=Reinekea marina TaxID=1310421 RepID=A0ABV7WSH8_9GAMM|nr:patatin-like phospholipase family protein [Reinekea marina]MDN3649091.1 patatin-like phospholipase family protein [Reinekea marina]
MQPLHVYAGQHALKHIQNHGLKPADISAILGASGGPKWFVLTHLDRYIAQEWLPNIPHQVELIGSSIGAWRMSAYANPNPVDAIAKLEQGYLHQDYSDNADAREITHHIHALLDSFIDESLSHNQSSRKLNIVAAISRGMTKHEQTHIQAAAFAGVALANMISRKTLPLWFERVIFQSTGAQLPIEKWDQFKTHQVPLRADNIRQALHATGSIPVVIEGVKNPAHAPIGMYRDGGMVDYHFDLPIKPQNGLVLYPHFAPLLKPGWFDKALPWRHVNADNYSHTVVVCPSAEFIAQLPNQKIPDRNDFKKHRTSERIEVWKEVIEKNKMLADAFHNMVNSPNFADTVKPITEFI